MCVRRPNSPSHMFDWALGIGYTIVKPWEIHIDKAYNGLLSFTTMQLQMRLLMRLSAVRTLERASYP